MDQEKEQPRDLAERLFAFALRIVRLASKLYDSPGMGRSFSYQLFKTGPAIGAYYEEAQAGEDRADFIRKTTSALKEARLTHYWLRLLTASEVLAPSLLADLVDENEQIGKILGSIVFRSKHNSD
jgi:four helix bundle protein